MSKRQIKMTMIQWSVTVERCWSLPPCFPCEWSQTKITQLLILRLDPDITDLFTRYRAKKKQQQLRGVRKKKKKRGMKGRCRGCWALQWRRERKKTKCVFYSVRVDSDWASSCSIYSLSRLTPRRWWRGGRRDVEQQSRTSTHSRSHLIIDYYRCKEVTMI